MPINLVNKILGITSYSLAQFVNGYLQANRPELAQEELDTPEGLEKSILAGSKVRENGDIDRRAGIRSRTAQKWLNRLGYKWKEVQKEVFFKRHEHEDVREYRKTIFNEMKSLLPYFVEFFEDGTMVPKEYPDDFAVGGPDRRPIIMITHDESTFSANDGRRKVWTLNGQGILRPKRKEKRIMVSDFLLPWSRLNLLSLSPQQQEDLASSGIPAEAVIYFEYGKTEEGYWTGEHLLDQIVKKTLPIGKVFYPSYELLFLFDNATSHSIYAPDALQVANMNKRPGGQQPFLRPGWFMRSNQEMVVQEMPTVITDPLTGQSTTIQKDIQAVLVERGLWPQEGVRLECEKPKCTNYQTLTRCRICVRGRNAIFVKKQSNIVGNAQNN